MDHLSLAELFTIFAVSLLLGAFIGLERERRERRPLGIRSFILISGVGTTTALVAGVTGMAWIVPAAFLVLGALLVIGHLGYVAEGRRGLTTELAAMMTFGLGILVFIDMMELAIALGVVTAALLHFKPQLHALAEGAGERHIYAMVQFGLVAFVVLPVLPNETYGPFDVLNPYNIWLMVVLVSAINLVGYVSYKLVGQRRGGAISGLLGGLISSTATTFSFSRRARESRDFTYAAVLAIILASAVTVPRMAVEIAIVNAQFLTDAWLALLIVFLASLIPFALYWFGGNNDTEGEVPEVKNPVQIGAALVFGLLYGLAIFFLTAAEHYYGEAGIYAISALSGLGGVDAITLSTARLVGEARLAAAEGVNVVIIAYLSNLAAKGMLATIFGTRRLGKAIGLAFSFAFVAGLIVIVAL